MYNYDEEVKTDVINYIRENYNRNDLTMIVTHRDSFENEVFDNCWNDDSVTGNASGSYFCNAFKAENALSGNWNLVTDALTEFGCTDVNAFERGPEYCDCIVRCYKLANAVYNALNELEDEAYEILDEIAEEED